MKADVLHAYISSSAFSADEHKWGPQMFVLECQKCTSSQNGTELQWSGRYCDSAGDIIRFNCCRKCWQVIRLHSTSAIQSPSVCGSEERSGKISKPQEWTWTPLRPADQIINCIIRNSNLIKKHLQWRMLIAWFDAIFSESGITRLVIAASELGWEPRSSGICWLGVSI